MEEKKQAFYQRSSCSGNLSNFVILPDGKVTICEQLYWQPEFIIGDLTKQSIMEIWNSKKAVELFNISADKMNNDSTCKNCDEFDFCRKRQGVCWKLVLAAYGKEKIDFPDPRCHFAPNILNNRIYI